MGQKYKVKALSILSTLQICKASNIFVGHAF